MNTRRTYIRFTRRPYEEPHNINLIVRASNGSLTSKLEVYEAVSSLAEWGQRLKQFSGHHSAVVLWELGSERIEDRWAHYFRFRTFATDSVGHCAIQLRFNNNRDLPDREIAEFCIRAEPSQINRLGELLREFGELKHRVLEWWVDDGALYESDDEA